jgi:hypothetical protein
VYRESVSRKPIDPAPEFTIRDERCESETLHCYAGARVLELATALPDLGVRVETVYVTDNGAVTQVTDLLIGPGESILATRRLSDHPICGGAALLGCVGDHAERVEAFLLSLGHEGARCELDPSPRPQARRSRA